MKIKFYLRFLLIGLSFSLGLGTFAQNRISYEREHLLTAAQLAKKAPAPKRVSATGDLLNYRASEVKILATPFVPLTATNSQAIVMPHNNGDDNSDPLPIGFTFNFRNTAYEKLIVNTNGFVKLGDQAPSAPNLYFQGSQVPADEGALFSLAPEDSDIVAPFNFNLVPIPTDSGKADFRIATTGSAPNRVCTIQWSNVQDTVDGPALQFNRIEFQVKFYEGSNTIDFVYGSWKATPLANAIFKAAQVGLRGQVGDYIMGSHYSLSDWRTTFFTNDNLQYNINQHNFRSNYPPQSGHTYRFNVHYAVNVGITGILAPQSACSFGASNTIQVAVANNGDAGLNDVPVQLFVNDTLFKELTLGYLDSNNVDTLFFESVDFSKKGIYALRAQVKVTGDLDSTNDVFTGDTVYNIEPEIATGQISAFETSADIVGWRAFDLNNDGLSWSISNNPAKAFSGSYFISIQNSSTGTTKDLLTTNCYALKGGTQYKVEWHMGSVNPTGTSKIELLALTDNSGDTTGALHLYKNQSFIKNIGTTKNYQDIIVRFTPANDGVYYLGWYVFSSRNANILAIDDFSLAEELTANKTSLSSVALGIVPNPAGHAGFAIEGIKAPIATATLLDALGRSAVYTLKQEEGYRLNGNLAPGLYTIRVAGQSLRVVVE